MNKQKIIEYFNKNAKDIYKWRDRNSYYYNDLKSFFCFNIEKNSKVLEIGSGSGELLDAVNSRVGFGMDLSSEVIKISQEKYPQLKFIYGDIDKELNIDEKFDYIILSDLIGYLEDIQTSFENLKKVCHDRSRIIVTQYNNIWWPILKFGEHIGLKQKQPITNWISRGDIINLFDLAGFEVIKNGKRLLFPKYIPLISFLLNKIVANLPLINHLCLVEYFTLRQKSKKSNADYLVSVIIPARNEKGNIEDAVKRIPAMGKNVEIIFVEGNSNDNTWEEIKRVADKYGSVKDIKYFKQEGKGKYDAVKKGFANSHGDILMILDADLTVQPEVLPKFYEVISRGKAEYVQGTRLIYPMEGQAMRFLNYLANKFFGFAFSWLLGQYITDTLCGTKVLFKHDYEKIAQARKFFGDFDPFGDFDLIFGADKLNLKIVELPIHYKDRQYGSTNISRFRHGIILFQMLYVGIKKFKLF
ncbi:glycosyltransferase [Candidatus Parcubacteria bacterium]|nr:glycosyltransferase [Candidatus Parcubacteria bacterium]